jgi:hypothetical protein
VPRSRTSPEPPYISFCRCSFCRCQPGSAGAQLVASTSTAVATFASTSPTIDMLDYVAATVAWTAPHRPAPSARCPRATASWASGLCPGHCPNRRHQASVGDRSGPVRRHPNCDVARMAPQASATDRQMDICSSARLRPAAACPACPLLGLPLCALIGWRGSHPRHGGTRPGRGSGFSGCPWPCGLPDGRNYGFVLLTMWRVLSLAMRPGLHRCCGSPMSSDPPPRRSQARLLSRCGLIRSQRIRRWRP